MKRIEWKWGIAYSTWFVMFRLSDTSTIEPVTLGDVHGTFDGDAIASDYENGRLSHAICSADPLVMLR